MHADWLDSTGCGCYANQTNCTKEAKNHGFKFKASHGGVAHGCTKLHQKKKKVSLVRQNSIKIWKKQTQQFDSGSI